MNTAMEGWRYMGRCSLSHKNHPLTSEIFEYHGPSHVDSGVTHDVQSKGEPICESCYVKQKNTVMEMTMPECLISTETSHPPTSKRFVDITVTSWRRLLRTTEGIRAVQYTGDLMVSSLSCTGGIFQTCRRWEPPE